MDETGAHPTLAGNKLDPNVRADGHMSSGAGVGGTSEGRIRQEGQEHLSKTGGYGPGDSSTGSTGESLTDSARDTVGLGSGTSSSGALGGTSGSGYGDSSVTSGSGINERSASGTSGGMIDTVKSYLPFGMGGQSGETTGT